MKVAGALEGYGAFVDAAAGINSPVVVSVTPLLRELLIRFANLPLLYEEGGGGIRD